MIFTIALSVAVVGAAALLLQQFRNRTLAAGDPPEDAIAESDPERRQAA